MSPGRGLRVLLAVALLAAWQAALVHPLAHLDAQGGYVHVAGSHDSRTPGDKTGATALCDAIAALASCVGDGASLSIAAVTARSPVSEHPIGVARGAPLLAYRSQAPPALL
jgi:hypothetical protein